MPKVKVKLTAKRWILIFTKKTLEFEIEGSPEEIDKIARDVVDGVSVS